MPEPSERLSARSAEPTGDPAGPVRLCDLPVGCGARLHRRDLSDGEACLLAAMGLTEGCRLVVRVVGDPCIVDVRTTRIGLSLSVAQRLLVIAELGEE
jgi:Fe2+ transport system protein FeoA